jgi:hypothetical protein
VSRLLADRGPALRDNPDTIEQEYFAVKKGVGVSSCWRDGPASSVTCKDHDLLGLGADSRPDAGCARVATKSKAGILAECPRKLFQASMQRVWASDANYYALRRRPPQTTRSMRSLNDQGQPMQRSSWASIRLAKDNLGSTRPPSAPMANIATSAKGRNTAC